MSFVSRLIDPNPPLTADQVQAAAAAALAASPPSPIRSIQRGRVSFPQGQHGPSNSGAVDPQSPPTITRVNPARAFVVLAGGGNGWEALKFNGQNPVSAGYQKGVTVSINSSGTALVVERPKVATVVNADRWLTVFSGGSFQYQVIEYY